MRSALAIVGLLALAAPAAAEPRGPGAIEQAMEAGMDRRFLGRLHAELAEARRQRVAQLGRIFEKIAVRRDYEDEHVLHRDAEVTAFLDRSDPAHPKYDPEAESDEDLEGLKNPAHILVVPNAPRQHIGRTLLAPVGAHDLETALKVVKSAERLAARFGIKNARVFLNPTERVMIGYLHVHIVGERDPARPYPRVRR